MKILYSQIKELIPELKTTPKEIADVFTLTGSMVDGFEEVRYQNKKDYLISLEIRQNRVDCLSIFGLAKEISAYYGLTIRLPDIYSLSSPFSKKTLDIKTQTKNSVKRILAIEIEGLKNKESPKWLKEFLSLYEINSVNFLVDLSNYAMFFTGYPSHLLDANKIDGQISWSLNKDFNKITTLDGSVVKLNKNELIIRDDKKILALAGIVGTKDAEIDLNTKTIIAEMAIYDYSIIRKNSRILNIITEASNRLTKNLDPNGSEFAMNILISMILKNCGGSVNSKIFEYYPKKYIASEIEFDSAAPDVCAGIDIPKQKAVEILKNLGFKIKGPGQRLIVIPPINRTDISIPEDLNEEVIRMFGYDKIPSNELPKLEIINNITPKNIYLTEKIRDILSVLGLDEILSWPLTKKEDNSAANYLNWDIINTQNSLNEDYPELRQSMAVNLINQLQKYLKKNVGQIKIFEIGKVFGKNGKNYEEYEALGILTCAAFEKKGLSAINEVIEKLLRSIGFADVSYIKSKIKPPIANPYSCWDIIIEGKTTGIIYKLKPRGLNQNTYFAEFNLNDLTMLLEKARNKPVIELAQKLIVLDANIELAENELINNFLAEFENKIKKENIWSIEIIDVFPFKEKIRYTIRVSYKGLSDREAKKIHLETFNL